MPSGSPTAEVRPAAPHDFDAVCAVLAEGDVFHRDGAPWMYRLPTGQPRDREFFDSILADPRQAMFVAVVNGTVVGSLRVQLRGSPDLPIIVPRRYAVVENVTVTTAHRRGGIARALMARAEEWAREQSVTEIELTVYAFNEPAQSLYDGLGFETVSRRMRKVM